MKQENKIETQDATQDLWSKTASLQAGRSMVEMLGVLAIIGVLSIGGIAGFNYAMNRYRANELLNDVTIRAVDLIAQSSRGITLNLDAWDTHSKAGYLINNPASTEDGLVYMEAHDVPRKVCEIAFATAGDYIPQIDIGGAKAISKNDCADTNTMAFYFEGDALPGADVSGAGSDKKETTTPDEEEDDETNPCGECQESLAPGYCFVAADGTPCSVGQCWDGQCLYCPNGVCQDCSFAGDTSCGDGNYCASQNDTCSTPNYSKCAKVSFRKYEMNGATYYSSKNSFSSWWNADSACKSIGKTLASVNDLIVGWSKPNTGFYPLTNLGQAIYEKEGAPFFWTTDNADGCEVYTAQVMNGNGGVNIFSKTGVSMTKALCK